MNFRLQRVPRRKTYHPLLAAFKVWEKSNFEISPGPTSQLARVANSKMAFRVVGGADFKNFWERSRRVNSDANLIREQETSIWLRPLLFSSFFLLGVVLCPQPGRIAAALSNSLPSRSCCLSSLFLSQAVNSSAVFHVPRRISQRFHPTFLPCSSSQPRAKYWVCSSSHN